MVSHAKLQYYKHNYGMVCVTGLLGCRWHRYKQSTADSRKRDVAWFSVLMLTVLYISFYLYYFLIAQNDMDDFNFFFFEETDKAIHWFTVFVAIISTMFSYIIILLLLALCHVVQGHQLYIHPVHLVFTLLILAFCTVITWVLTDLWQSEWTVIYLSLRIIGPFLQIGAVGIMTISSWIIVQQWYRIHRLVWKILWLCVYLCVMVGLYICPIFINSPCVVEKTDLPAKPRMFAHRGASGLAPENTVIAFQKAADLGTFGLESDVHLSYDGIPFMNHDNNLKRTTNVASVFPALQSQHSSLFNISQLQQLDAGSWFLQTDPMHTVGSLSEADKRVYRNQTIPTFHQFLQLAKTHKLNVMFDIFQPATSNPYYNKTTDLILQVIQETGIPHRQVWWLNNSRPGFLSSYRVTSRKALSVAYLKSQNITRVNVQYDEISDNQFHDYQNHSIMTNVYTVNTGWLFSFYWCMGVESVTSNMVHQLADQTAPVWHMPPESYLLLWIAVDITSAVVVLIIFIVQRVRLQDTKYSPDIGGHTGSSATWRSYRTRRSMKEKLLRRDIPADNFEQDQDRDNENGVDSNYEVTITPIQGRAMARTYHSNSDRYQTEVELA